MDEYNDNAFGKLPDHLLVEIFVRLPICEWGQLSSVSKHWATIFRGESLWQTAIARTWPFAGQRKRWPGPIPRGLGRRKSVLDFNGPFITLNSWLLLLSLANIICLDVITHSTEGTFPQTFGCDFFASDIFESLLKARRYAALYVSEHIIASNGEIDELVGHIYLYLKEQLELSIMPPPSSILHGTIIDQFIACGRSRDKAYELASQIWLAVINNLEENEQTFLLLKRLAQEGDSFLPYPYSRPYKVLWRVFEKLFTDFRDCFSHSDYCDILACAKSRFQPIPSSWLGY